MLARDDRLVTDDTKESHVAEGPAASGGERDIPKLDTTVPQTARIWNYLLGGKDNFAADREVGDQIIQNLPQLAENAKLSRAYLARAVRHLAGEAGIRQFLDIGTGLPTADNTHEVAQSVVPEARIVYVDNDPLVLAHARALLTTSAAGATAYIDADIRDSKTILTEAAKTLDLTQPVALFLMGILGHVESDDEARGIIRSFVDELPSGSYVAMYDGSDTSPDNTEAVRIWNISANPKYHLRTPERFASLFEGLEIVEPGIVSVVHWRPEPGTENTDEIPQYAVVARKP